MVALTALLRHNLRTLTKLEMRTSAAKAMVRMSVRVTPETMTEILSSMTVLPTNALRRPMPWQ